MDYRNQIETYCGNKIYATSKDRFGSVFSRTNLLLANLLMCVWVKVKVLLKVSLLRLLQVVLLSKAEGVPYKVAKSFASCSTEASCYY